MIAVDTNLLVRLLVRDDESQYQQAYKILQENMIFVSNTVFLETEWVLRFTYKFPSAQVTEALRRIAGFQNTQTEDIVLLQLAFDWHEQGLDFADAMHLALSQHCTQFVTFDRKFARRSRSLSTIPVGIPTQH
ncbi:MAG: type II toxin-antitoxin system VapC family toxin [Candidatus Promineifilaceae bacterium]